jgi:hypothetical protein
MSDIFDKIVEKASKPLKEGKQETDAFTLTKYPPNPAYPEGNLNKGRTIGTSGATFLEVAIGLGGNPIQNLQNMVGTTRTIDVLSSGIRSGIFKADLNNKTLSVSKAFLIDATHKLTGKASTDVSVLKDSLTASLANTFIGRGYTDKGLSALKSGSELSVLAFARANKSGMDFQGQGRGGGMDVVPPPPSVSNSLVSFGSTKGLGSQFHPFLGNSLGAHMLGPRGDDRYAGSPNSAAMMMTTPMGRGAGFSFRDPDKPPLLLEHELDKRFQLVGKPYTRNSIQSPVYGGGDSGGFQSGSSIFGGRGGGRRWSPSFNYNASSVGTFTGPPNWYKGPPASIISHQHRNWSPSEDSGYSGIRGLRGYEGAIHLQRDLRANAASQAANRPWGAETLDSIYGFGDRAGAGVERGLGRIASSPGMIYNAASSSVQKGHMSDSAINLREYRKQSAVDYPGYSGVGKTPYDSWAKSLEISKQIATNLEKGGAAIKEGVSPLMELAPLTRARAGGSTSKQAAAVMGGYQSAMHSVEDSSGYGRPRLPGGPGSGQGYLRDMGIGGVGGKGKGGMWDQIKTQFRHAAIWQAYTPIIGGAGYMAYKMLGGDFSTDKATHQLVGVGMEHPDRMDARDWAYKAAARLPYSTPAEHLRTYKEVIGGMGIRPSATNNPLLQDLSEVTHTFAKASQQDPYISSRRLSRASVMQSEAEGDMSSANRAKNYKKIANQLTGILEGSSVIQTEIDTAMHYAGPTALKHLGWGYGETAGYMSGYIERGMSVSNVGVHIRDLGSPASVEAMAKARIFAEEFEKNAQTKGYVRDAIPWELTNKGAFTSKKNLAMKQRMTNKEAEIMAAIKSGNAESVANVMWRAAQDFAWLKDTGINSIKPHESQQPILTDIAGTRRREFIERTKSDMGRGPEAASANLKQQLQDLQVQGQQSGFFGLMGSSLNYGVTSLGEALGIPGVTQAWYKWKNTRSHTENLSNAMYGGNEEAIKKALADTQMGVKAGVISPGDVKKDINVIAANLAQSKFPNLRERGLAMQGMVQSWQKELGVTPEQWESNDNRRILPDSLASPEMREIMKPPIKDPTDIFKGAKIKDGYLQVTINPEQVDQMRAKNPGYDPSFYTEDSTGTRTYTLTPSKQTKKPESPTALPHDGTTDSEGKPFNWTWGVGTGLQPTEPLSWNPSGGFQR